MAFLPDYRPKLALITIIAPLLGGCGAGDSGDTGTGEPEVRARCECVLDEEGGEAFEPSSSPSIPGCADQVCDIVSAGYYDPNDEFNNELVIADSAALACALTALRDRTPGLIRWSVEEALGGDYGYVLIKGDGQAVRRTWSILDLGASIDDAVLGDLAPPATYDSCLALTDEAKQFECLNIRLMSENLICDEAWSVASE